MSSMLGVLGALWLGNVAMHAEALGLAVAPGLARRAELVAVDVVVFVIALMAGRVFPMFMRNATGVPSVRNVPALDRAAIGSLAAMIAFEIAMPERGALIAGLAGTAGLFAIARAVHCVGSRA